MDTDKIIDAGVSVAIAGMALGFASKMMPKQTKKRKSKPIKW